MTSNVVNQVAYLKSSRNFPQDLQELAFQSNTSYVDIANAVNLRIIGIFPTNRPAITGESWYLTKNQRQQTLRQTYNITSTTAINHGIQVIDPDQFTRCFGSYTNGTSSFGLFWATSVAIAGQITFYLTSSQIVFLVGAGAPALIKGKVTLEWLSPI
jgi:hypothetical protein